MKKLYAVLALLISISYQVNAQQTMESALRFTNYNYFLDTDIPPNGTPAQSGPDYGCLINPQRPIWQYFTNCADTPAIFGLSITYHVYLGFPGYIDTIGFIMWGPIFDTTNIVNQLTAGNIDTCFQNQIYSMGFNNIFLQRKVEKNAFYYFMFSNADSLNSYWINGSGTARLDSGCSICTNHVSQLLQDICIVATDSATQKNMIVWEPDPTDNLDNYTIYREGAIANQFDSIATVSATSSAVFIDQLVNPALKSYRYKIGARDACGNLNITNNIHETIHLSASAGILGEVNLSWNPYVGFSYPTFYIYRGSTQANLQPLDSIASTGATYTDFSPLPGLNFYRVFVQRPGGCQPDSNTFISSSRSNVSYANVVGINEPPLAKLVLLYPNPAKNLVTIDYSSINQIIQSIEFKNMLGQIMQTIKPSSTKHQIIATDGLNRGFYFIELKSDKGLIRKKLMLN